jgi:hypothetical protein
MMMNRHSLFWGIVLILVGGVFLLSNLGIFIIPAWSLIWPILIIALGLWLLLSVFVGKGTARAEQISIPLEEVDAARVKLSHGAGRLLVGDGAGPAELISGVFSGGLDYRTRRDGNRLDLKLSVPEGSFPFFGWPGTTLDWDVAFNPQVALSLDIKTGANESNLNLENLRVVDLKLQTGASSTALTLPARAGFTRGRVEAGAASVEIRIPHGVGARIRVESGLADVSVDRMRFPRQGDVYYSSDYEISQNKLDLEIQAGVGSVSVR